MPQEGLPVEASEALRELVPEPDPVRKELATWGAVRNPALIEVSLRKLDGVASAAATALSGTVAVEHASTLSEVAIRDTIQSCGYPPGDEPATIDPERPEIRIQALVTIVCALLFIATGLIAFPAVMSGMRLDFGPWTVPAGPFIERLQSWFPVLRQVTPDNTILAATLLAALSTVLCCWTPLRRATATARRRVVDDDSLAALAMVACLAALAEGFFRSRSLAVVTAVEISLAVSLLRLRELRQTTVRLRARKQRAAASRSMEEIGPSGGTLAATLGSALQSKSTTESHLQSFARYVPSVAVAAALASALLQWTVSHSLTSALLGFAAAALTVSSSVLLLAGSAPGASALTEAFSHGLIFKGMSALQRLSRIRTAILSRRGVVIEPVPGVSDYILLDGCTHSELLSNARSVATESSHPVARAVRDRAGDRVPFVPAAGVTPTRSRGLSGKVAGETIVFGQPRWVEELGTDLSAMHDEIDHYSREGKSVMVVTRDGQASGAIAFRETLLADSRDAIRELRRLGVSSILASEGDPRSVEQLGASIDVELRQWTGGTSTVPTKAAREIARVSYETNPEPGEMVSVVVDDRPSAALASADVLIRRKGLTNLVLAIRLAKASTRIFRRNVASWSLFTLLALVAASGALTPLFGSWTWLAISSLLTTVGSLALTTRVRVAR